MAAKATLFSIIIFSKDEKTSIYQEEYNLGSFSYFKRTAVQEMLRFLSKRVAESLDTAVPQELVHRMEEGESYKFFVKEKSDLIYVTASLLEYPSNTLSLLIEDISKQIKSSSRSELAGHLKVQMKEYQDYEQKDIMLQIKNELGKVEEILTKTVESALGRGEKIDELISSADSLSFQTKSLYKLSRKQNKRCCGIM
ncbi:synaptobrevin-like protein YKT6 [Nematocida homosporus]|uniref:synaptobrevin-like protein YKT6 n=1 Tax=Nematocida homosporus TaxID=1912981 RepID=UPI002220C5F9|nr:synaptobrevin-like protein YKT6 [Nematocida homosporus]KAI5186762.1 synaptobrevin-like protein YKT6 [Nematocida homosporus]